MIQIGNLPERMHNLCVRKVTVASHTDFHQIQHDQNEEMHGIRLIKLGSGS